MFRSTAYGPDEVKVQLEVSCELNYIPNSHLQTLVCTINFCYNNIRLVTMLCIVIVDQLCLFPLIMLDD